MSRTIDNRVVEMTFDNKQFEQGVAESRQSLKQLDKDLQFENASQGLINLNQAFDSLDLSNIERGVLSLQDRFSTFGIFTMQVIERLSNSLINFATNSLSKVFGQIATGGTNRAMNIENAKFQMQGLLKDESKVNDILDAVNKSVDGTAYGYDEAAKAAAMFVATGYKTKEAVYGPLRAVAGVAAQTNSDYSRMADIFTTVAGNGRLMGQQLTQLSTYGLNAAATIAEWFDTNGEAQRAYRKELKLTGKVTEAEIRDLVSDGKISFALFSKAMEDAFGDHAKDANKTFTGAMSNIKAALSRIGANFVQPLIEQEGPMVRMFNSLRTMINAINKVLPPFNTLFIDTVTGITEKISELAGKVEEKIGKLHANTLVKAISNILYTIKWLFDQTTESFGKFFKLPTISNLNDLISNFQKLTLKIQQFVTTNENVIKIINGIATAFNIVKNVFGAVYTVIKNVFTGLAPLRDQFFEILGKISDGIVDVNNWINTTDILNKAVNKITAVLSPFINLITSIYTIIKNTFKSGGGGAGGIINAFFSVLTRSITATMHSIEELLGIDLSKEIGWVINKLRNLKDIVMESAPFFNNFIGFFKDFAKILYNSFTEAGGGLDGIVSAIFNVLTRAVTTLMHAFEDLTGIDLSSQIGHVIVFFRKAKETVLGARDGIQELKDAIKTKWESKEFEGLRNLFENIKETFINVRNTISNGVNEFNSKLGGLDLSGFTGFLGGFFKVLLGFGNAIGVVLDSLWTAISPFITDLTSALSEGDIQKMLDIFTAFLGSLAGLKTYQSYMANIGWVFSFFEKLPTLLSRLTSPLTVLQSIGNYFSQQIKTLKWNQIKSLATSILMIAAAAYLLSKIPEDDMLRVTATLYAMISLMTGIAITLTQLETKATKSAAGPLLALGVSILLIAAAMKVLSKIDEDALTRSFTTVVGLLAAITAAITVMTAVEGSLKKVGGTMIAMAVAMLILAASIKMISKIEPNALARSFGIIVTLIAEITTALMLLMAASQTGSLSKVAGTFIAISIGLLIISASLALLSKMDQNELQSAFSVMSLMILEIVGVLGALLLLQKIPGSNIGEVAATMILAAAAILILSIALAFLTKNINPDNAAAALIVLGVALAEIAIALTFMQDAIAGAGALMIAAVAILVLSMAFKSLAELDPQQIVAGITALGVALLLLVAAVVALTLIPGGVEVLLGIAVSLLMLGLSFMAVGAGVALIGAGLLMITTALIAFAAVSTVIISGTLTNLAVLLQGLRVIIPLIVAVVIDFFVAFFKSLTARIGVLIDFIKTLVIKILDMLIELLPTLKDFLIILINALFDVLDMLIPRLINFLEIVLDNVLSFLEWAIPRILEAVVNLFMGIFDVIGEKGPQLADHAATMFINLIDGLATVVEEREPELKAAIEHLIQAVLDAILDLLGLAPGSEPVGDAIFGDFIVKMCLGIESKKMELWYKVTEMIREAIVRIRNKLSEAFTIGKNFIQGLINGIGSKVSDLVDAVGNAGADVIEALVSVFQTHSPSRVTEEIGENFDQGFINGVKKLSSKMADAAEISGVKVLDKFTEVVEDIYGILDSDMDFNPTITPILDASDLEDGITNIGGMFSSYGLNASGSYNLASDLDSEPLPVEEIQNEDQIPSTINFVQNNYSPKSLSRIDIYRDTKNALNNPTVASIFNR